MRKKDRNNLLLATLFVIVSVATGAFIHLEKRQTAGPQIESRVADVVYCGGCFIGPQLLKITPEFTSPSKVEVGQAFFIEAKLDITGSFSEDLQGELLQNLSASLHLAGAEVSPDEPQIVGIDAEIRWSVTFQSWGEHQGFVTLSETQPGGLSGGRIFLEEGKIAVLATSIERSLTMIWAVVALIIAVLGAFMKTTQFLWDWRKQKRERAKLTSKETTKLILPD